MRGNICAGEGDVLAVTKKRRLIDRLGKGEGEKALTEMGRRLLCRQILGLRLGIELVCKRREKSARQLTNSYGADTGCWVVGLGIQPHKIRRPVGVRISRNDDIVADVIFIKRC